jgi:hypothetical protein
MYYPLSQIKTNLYTNGGEYFILNTNEPYIGYYFKTSNGKYFTGKTPQDLPNQELVNISTLNNVNEINDPLLSPIIIEQEDTNNIPYLNLSNQNLTNITYNPYYSPTLPTPQDYQNEEFQRYFCKKTNEIQYIEINQTQFDKLVIQDPQIEFSLYEPFTITWQLTGDKQTVARVNKNVVELTMIRQKLPKFNLYLKEDYTKYYQ